MQHCAADRKKPVVLAAHAGYQVGVDQSPTGLLEEHVADAAHLVNMHRLIDPIAIEVGRFSQPMDQYVALRLALMIGQNWPELELLIDAAYYAQNQRLTLVV